MAFHQGHPGVYSDTDPEHPSPDAPFKRTRKNRPTELEIIGKVSPKTTGTRIRYWADPEIFNDTAEFSYEQLIDRVRQTSFLVPGLRITVIDENVPETGDDSVDEMMEVDAAQTPADDGTGLMDAADIASAADTAVEDTVEAGEAEARSAAVSAAVETAKVDAARHTHARVEEFRHTGGVKDFVDFLSAGEAVSDIWRITGEDTYEEETQAVGEGGELHAQKVTRKCGVDIAMRWTNGYDTTMRSFVNVVETPGGGMHVDGFLMGSPSRSARPLKTRPQTQGEPQGLEHARRARRHPGRTRGRRHRAHRRAAVPGADQDVLGTAPVKPIVTRMTDKQFGEMITGSKRGYKEQSGRVLEKIVGEMHARIQARKTKEVTRRKNALESAAMPSKLSDCQPGNDDVAELFIVEGDSALGTAKAARNSGFQALLPIRGKILNVQKASLSQMLNNKECAAIIQVSVRDPAPVSTSSSPATTRSS